MAKLLATGDLCADGARRRASAGGGMGFMEESCVARVDRNVKMLAIRGGTLKIMRGIVGTWLGL